MIQVTELDDSKQQDDSRNTTRWLMKHNWMIQVNILNQFNLRNKSTADMKHNILTETTPKR